MVRVGLLAAALWVFVSVSGCQAPGGALAIKAAEGETRLLIYEDQTVFGIPIAAHTVTFTVNTNLRIDLTVGAPDEAGNTLLLAEVKSAEVDQAASLAGFGINAVPGGLQSPKEAMAGLLEGVRFRFTLDAAGRVITLTGLEDLDAQAEKAATTIPETIQQRFPAGVGEGLDALGALAGSAKPSDFIRSLLEETFTVAPGKAVGIGALWGSAYADGRGLTQIDRAFELLELGDGRAKAVISGTVRPDPRFESIELSGTLKGDIEIDTATGFGVMQGTVQELSGTAGGVSALKVSIERTIEVFDV